MRQGAIIDSTGNRVRGSSWNDSRRERHSKRMLWKQRPITKLPIHRNMSCLHLAFHLTWVVIEGGGQEPWNNLKMAH